jgi:NTE family protein
MLEELIINRGLDFRIIRGVSVGALNAAFLAQAATGPGSLVSLQQQVRALKQLWETEIRGNGSVYRNKAGLVGIAAGADSLFSLEPLWDLLGKYLDLARLRSSGRDFAVGTVSLVTGEYCECKPDTAYFLDKLLASASIPVVFPAVDVKREDDLLVDGGVRNITPLSSAFAAEPDEVYVLLTSRTVREGERLPSSTVLPQDYAAWEDNWLGTRVGGMQVLERVVDILTDEVYLDDIRGALHWNEVAAAAAKVSEAARAEQLPAAMSEAVDGLDHAMEEARKRPVPLYVIAPRVLFGEDNASTNFSPDLIREAIAHGRQVAADPALWLWPPA